jgi:hypothetical protein
MATRANGHGGKEKVGTFETLYLNGREELSVSCLIICKDIHSADLIKKI